MPGQSPEQIATWEATKAVRRILASARNPRTVLGKAAPTVVAYHAAHHAVSVYREALAHERARRSGGACGNCGRLGETEPEIR